MTHDSALAAAQQGIYERLTDALAVPAYDDVPDDADYPYVIIGEAVETPVLGLDFALMRVATVLHIFSAQLEMSELHDLIAQVAAAMGTELLLSSTGWQQIDYSPGRREVYRDYDNAGTIIRHGEIELIHTLEATI